jgi:hypothetical protein
MLYVNGDSHTTAAEAVNQYVVAGEDQKFLHLGPLPHPENLAVSWGKMLSLSLRVAFHCAAYSNNTVDKIIEDSPPSYNYHDNLLPKFYAQLYSREPPPSKFVSTPLQPIFTFKNRKTIFQNFENFITKDFNVVYRQYSGKVDDYINWNKVRFYTIFDLKNSPFRDVIMKQMSVSGV